MAADDGTTRQPARRAFKPPALLLLIMTLLLLLPPPSPTPPAMLLLMTLLLLLPPPPPREPPPPLCALARFESDLTMALAAAASSAADSGPLRPSLRASAMSSCRIRFDLSTPRSVENVENCETRAGFAAAAEEEGGSMQRRRLASPRSLPCAAKGAEAAVAAASVSRLAKRGRRL